MNESLRIEAIDYQMAEVLRAKTPAERLAIAHGMWSHARSLIQRILQTEHPDWSNEQISVQVARRMSHGSI